MDVVECFVEYDCFTGHGTGTVFRIACCLRYSIADIDKPFLETRIHFYSLGRLGVSVVDVDVLNVFELKLLRHGTSQKITPKAVEPLGSVRCENLCNWHIYDMAIPGTERLPFPIGLAVLIGFCAPCPRKLMILVENG